MVKVAGGIVALILFAMAGGAVYLATFDIPAPSVDRTKVLDDSRFPR